MERIQPFALRYRGKFVLIDIETGAWEMDADKMTASRRMDTRLPETQVWMLRIGYPYARRFGAGLRRRAA